MELLKCSPPTDGRAGEEGISPNIICGKRPRGVASSSDWVWKSK